MGRSGEDRPIDGLPQVSHGQPGWALYKLLWPSEAARPSYSPSVSIRSLMLQEGDYVTPNRLHTLGQAVTQPLPQTFQSVRQCHPWYLLQVASLPCMFRLLSLLCTFCTTVACNQLACVQTQFGEFFWRGCLPSKASRSNNRLHCLRECTSTAATKGRAPLSHRFSMYVHVGVVGYTWAFRCGYKIRFSKLLKLLVFNYTLLHLDVLVWVIDLFFLAEHQRQCVTVKFTC